MHSTGEEAQEVPHTIESMQISKSKNTGMRHYCVQPYFHNEIKKVPKNSKSRETKAI